MSRQTGAVLVTVLLLALGTGCTESCKKCCCPSTRPTAPPPPRLPTVARGNMEMLFHGLPPLVADETLPGSAPDLVTTYLALTPRDCQCLAVRCCGVANLMDRERRAVAEQEQSKCLCLVPKKQMGAALK